MANKGQFQKGHTYEMGESHKRAISTALKMAWVTKRNKRPIGERMERNGKLYEWIETPKGWRHWRLVREEITLPEDLFSLTSAQRSKLRKRGYQIPKLKRGCPVGHKQSFETRMRKSISKRKYLFDMRAIASEEKERIRKSLVYREWRQAVFERDNYTCQKCGDRSGNGHEVKLEAHHIKPYSKYPKLRFRISNGKTLCIKCHKETVSQQMQGNQNGRRKVSTGITPTSGLP